MIAMLMRTPSYLVPADEHDKYVLLRDLKEQLGMSHISNARRWVLSLGYTFHRRRVPGASIPALCVTKAEAKAIIAERKRQGYPVHGNN